ncbi:peptidoglycan-binding protein [Micromonospora carbonacea]|uniref:Putative peptidoglycan binding domain-containing protein n=1 Tax=Micromonospora carbonacea TaxID=47853 RepID=A0A1C5ARH7_9ACTN|nr:peptidoglycan-binding protein [Micromonospora carbonacea]SCF47812.1 Putative peptidoglycan binding domain-containing protein [Micromonospora carbonacea]
MSAATADRSGGPVRVRRERRRRWLLGSVVAVAVLTTGGATAYSRLQHVSAEPTRKATPRRTATVVRTDLVERIVVDGTVGYGRSSPVTGRRAGTITWLPSPGALVGRGERLYSVDADPVPLLVGDTPMYRDIGDGVSAGPDVLVLERNLDALGYDVGTVDGRFRSGTRRALGEWQRKLGLPETGRLALGDVVVLPGEVRVDKVTGQLGGSAQGEVLDVTGVGRLVRAGLEEAQRRFARPAAKVRLDLADGRSTTGTVRSVAAADADEEDRAALTVTIDFTDPGLATKVDTGPVTVRFDGVSRADALALPVEALLALREGGYGIEAVEGEQRYHAVELGLFADGMVEVSGDGVVEGMTVVVAG